MSSEEIVEANEEKHIESDHEINNLNNKASDIMNKDLISSNVFCKYRINTIIKKKHL